jgi:hypothetical protein
MRLPELVSFCVHCALMALVLSGCSSGLPPETAAQEEHLRQLAYMYGRYMAMHQGQVPGSEREFRAFIEQLGPEERSRFGVGEELDSLFVSPRDKQPYAVAYQKPFGLPGQELIAYEQAGVNGKRYIADLLADVREVEEAEFRQRVPSGS